jgi:hypothetical protein
MKTRITIIGLGIVAAVALSSTAYAWSVKEDHGSYQIIIGVNS